MPDIEGGLRDAQEACGAEFAEGSDVPERFGNELEALAALEEGAALVDRSDSGVLRVTGEDRLRFLHNLTTADVEGLEPGQGCDTVFVTSAGRTLDLATLLVQGESVLVICSPGMDATLEEIMNKYIFPMDKVEVGNLSGEMAMLTLVGGGAAEMLGGVGLPPSAGAGMYGEHALYKCGEGPVLFANSSSLSFPGVTLLMDVDAAGDVWEVLEQAGAVPMGTEAYECARIVNGRPKTGLELTEEHNPYEAALVHTVSLQKGCYLGQETLARLATYDGVKEELWGLRFAASVGDPPPPGARVWAADDAARTGRPLGVVTSSMRLPGGVAGGPSAALAYLRRKGAPEPGTEVAVLAEGAESGEPVLATVADIAYAVRGYPKQTTANDNEGEAGAAEDAESAAAEEARKAAKLAAMQARLEAFQRAQKEQQQ